MGDQPGLTMNTHARWSLKQRAYTYVKAFRDNAHEVLHHVQIRWSAAVTGQWMPQLPRSERHESTALRSAPTDAVTVTASAIKWIACCDITLQPATHPTSCLSLRLRANPPARPCGSTHCVRAPGQPWLPRPAARRSATAARWVREHTGMPYVGRVHSRLQYVS